MFIFFLHMWHFNFISMQVDIYSKRYLSQKESTYCAICASVALAERPRGSNSGNSMSLPTKSCAAGPSAIFTLSNGKEKHIHKEEKTKTDKKNWMKYETRTRDHGSSSTCCKNTYLERVIRPAGAKAAAVLSKAMVAITVAYMMDKM